MNKIITIFAAVLLTASVFLPQQAGAQVPEKMSYQAVIRDDGGNLVTEQEIGMQISILQGTADGAAVYTETQTPTTNDKGLVSIEIGGGAGFSTINWASGNYYINTKTAVVTPLTTYTITGVSQLLSVPYALHAKTAENGITAQADGSETKLTAGTNVTVTGSGTTASPYVVNSTRGSLYLGEEYLGGIIFYLYTDNTGTQKGLIVSKTESTGNWDGTTLVGANRTEDGAYNTNLMPAGSTAKTWITALGAGWYLPSIDELSILWHNRYHVNKTARAVGSTLLSTTANYWSSLEYNATYAFYFIFHNGTSNYSTNASKSNTYRVRAVRAF